MITTSLDNEFFRYRIPPESKVLYFPPRRYLIQGAGDLVIPSRFDLVFAPGAFFMVDTNLTVHIHGRVEALDFPVFCAPYATLYPPSGINYNLPLTQQKKPVDGAQGQRPPQEKDPPLGKVKLLSPRQKNVHLRWFGAMPVPFNGTQDYYQPFFDSAAALEAAILCAAFDREQTRDDGGNLLSLGLPPLPPLPILADAGVYRLLRDIVLPTPRSRAKVILRGAGGGGSTPPLSTFERIVPENSTLAQQAAFTTLTVNPATDLDLHGVSFKCGAFVGRHLHLRLRGTSERAQRIHLEGCTMLGGYDAAIKVEELPGNEAAVVRLHQTWFDPSCNTDLGRSSIQVDASSKVLLHLSSSGFGLSDLTLPRKLGDPTFLRLKGGSTFVENTFFHEGNGPFPVPPGLRRTEPDPVYPVLPWTEAPLSFASGQDIFLEHPNPPGANTPDRPWAHLTLFNADSQSWALLASQKLSQLRPSLPRPVLLFGVTANNVNGPAVNTPNTYARIMANRSPDSMVEAPWADCSPCSIHWIETPSPLVMVGCRLMGATIRDSDGNGVLCRTYECGAVYTPLGVLGAQQRMGTYYRPGYLFLNNSNRFRAFDTAWPMPNPNDQALTSLYRQDLIERTVLIRR